ncbi:hypothetical protein BKA66DRAFT_417580 [Pyrenochaeta sp. MPI-SDFR-AT-0127]|nr:hypothetical protein BKA66DRAFT_417580 [Pyrenochaeta sp. MPI-SDFR-AT-0127]
MAPPVRIQEQLYFHVALPRNVPGQEDRNIHHIENDLLSRLTHATSYLYPNASPQHRHCIRGLQDTLVACKSLNVDGIVPKSALLRELRNLDSCAMLILHATAQNCALLVYEHILESGERQVVFEAFETSASCETVLACQNALLWDFPGWAVAVPYETYSEQSFQQSLATFIEQASSELIVKFAAITVKAAKTIPEIRDTSKPDLVSRLLMTILEANGSAFTTPFLRKRVRDTVSFDSARKPWRRSPFYLMLRVAMQRYLYRQLGAEIGRMYYKFIMCVMLSNLLEDALKRLPFDAAFFLRQKLGRRLAKLESDMANAPATVAKIYAYTFRSLESSFQTTLSTTGGYLKSVWKNHRRRSERQVPILRQRAFDHELNLRLASSGRILLEILALRSDRVPVHQHAPSDLLKEYEQSVASVKPYMAAADRYISVSRYHEHAIVSAKVSEDSGSPRCIRLSQIILHFVRKIEATINAYPGQLSQMLLHLMELWMLMDKAAVACYPLLKEFHPGFEPDILDPIQLLTIEEMERVQQVQIYLEGRCLGKGGHRCLTIFDDPTDACFAARYYDDYDHAQELLEMRQEIEEGAALACLAKEEEWEQKSCQHREIIEKRNEKDCKWDAVPMWDGTAEHRHRWPCEWHELQNKAKSIRITIFEHPLPNFEPAVKAALFELRCPAAFAAYRDATWLILSTLCHPPAEKLERISLIREYSQLRSYSNATNGRVALGSDKKAHLECHYSNWGFPVGLLEVCRSCGLKPRYYDTIGQNWTDSHGKASFSHHFLVELPKDSAFQVIAPSFANWPSSNEIQASQANCPANISVHEFLAWQGLLVGTHSRWFDLFREMGSTNLNFSADSTWVLVERLVLQVGPAASTLDPRRDVHSALLDNDFCRKLLDQIRQRLESIHRNWREPVQMDILITILLRVMSLSNDVFVQDTSSILLRRARQITATWLTELQSNVTEDTKSTQFMIWASLLCKRTIHLDRHILLQPDVLCQFLRASIMLHYNLTGNFALLPFNLRTAIMRDISFTFENRSFLKDMIVLNADTFIATVDNLWQIPKHSNAFSELRRVPDTWWILLTLRSESKEDLHFVHYNYLYGTLLIDGQEMSGLPLAYRSHPAYREVFGSKNPIVFSSPLSGMDFAISETFKSGHRIHLGLRKAHGLIIRAVHDGQILELIPRRIFGTPASSDLPASMIEGCFHWLNVHTGHLEIRRMDIWTSRPGNWWIYGIKSGVYQAVRRKGSSQETRLLEPASGMARDIFRVFDYFERPLHILVYKSRSGRVSIELKRLELSFFINEDGLLQSFQLGAVIMQNQDVGTWYGLKSKILVQSTGNRRQKSVLVPLGEIRASRDGPHVSLEITTNSGIYLNFSVNEVLGRIDCAPEPALLYVRALLHAYTSNVVYDPLTRRTGSEEALYLLQTGSHMPWSPLSDENILRLKQIAHLSPSRSYYPKDMKCMETITWHPDLPISMQDERYREVVARVLQRSSELSEFFLDRPIRSSNQESVVDPHLAARALSRTHKSKPKDDNVYHTRDKPLECKDRINVLLMTKLLCKWQIPLSDGPTLTSLLQDAPVIGGYDKFFQKCLLTDLLTVDLRAEWGALVQKSLHSSIGDRYNLMFLFGPIAFSNDANINLMRVLISFVMIPELKRLDAPQYPAYFHFRADGVPPSSYLMSLIERAKMPFLGFGFKKRSQLVIAESLHEVNVKNSCEILAYSIQEQWPNPEIRREEFRYIDPVHLDIDKAIADVTPEWVRLTQNHEFALYLEKVQEVLSRSLANGEAPVTTEFSVSTPCKELYPTRLRNKDDPTLSDLLQKCIGRQILPEFDLIDQTTDQSRYAALAVSRGNVSQHSIDPYAIIGKMPGKQPFKHPMYPPKSRAPQNSDLGLLRTIVAKFQNTSSFVQTRYAQELETSIDALHKCVNVEQETTRKIFPRVTTAEVRPAKEHAGSSGEHIRCSLEAKDPRTRWLKLVDLWPRMTTVDILSELRSTSGVEFGPGAKEALVAFGLAITKLQRLLRIQDAQKRLREHQERDEWANQGHSNWNPSMYPDWLLLEIDGDILLREEQIQVALATIAPQSGENSVLQLLMGKGKTSCILPMVAAILANKVDLARIVVPRPLLLQSAQVMQAKLGNLANREIIHLPFSRKTPTNRSLIALYGRLHSQLRDNHGVILALPEHILSFKLSGIQKLCDDHIREASGMIKIQDWLDKHARDVLDECDVSLAIRTQLIYPSGSQITVDGHPMRWQVTQILLHLVKDLLPTVQARNRHSIEIVKRGNDGFPLIYFLRRDAEDYLIELLVGIISKGQVPSIFPCAEYPVAIIKDVKAYISIPMVRNQVISHVIENFRDKPQLMKTLNLLRGLFVHRILIATLKKRWNVQYGLHSTRPPIAVPYLAKGVPSPASEWGHPDVAIVLTCLSFYYQGLSMSQFKQAFTHLAKSDEPSVEYEKWFPKGADIPRELDDYAAINVEDKWQLHDLFNFVQYSASLVDFYLNNFVFPKYAKSFQLKLQASGWNLFPSISARKMGCRVTGFSGTNDSRHQLPMLIKQRDLPHLAHTNAEVLYYLLAPRNQVYVHMSHANGVRWSELDLIDRLAGSYCRHGKNHTKTRILIDAGAQVLEHSNEDFAKAWLDKDTDAAAAVYFADDHRAWALYRTGKKTPLLASPFAGHLERCVVYVDESHCRGTDLKLPAEATAALTLGQHLTKDALVQAAMRLRLLGQSQSVAFYSPPEVHQGILDRLQKDDSHRPRSEDVLHWVIGQTCDAIEQQDPSFFAQTLQYMQQEQARLDNPDILQTERSRASFLNTVRVTESMTLKQLYEPKKQRRAITESSWAPSIQGFAEELQHRKTHFRDSGTAVHASALEEVEIEQERQAEIEVETEVEDVRELQRPPQLTALAIPRLHKDIEHFSRTGILVAGSNAFRPMFSVLGDTALGLKHAISPTMNSNLWVSTQFNRTVEVYRPHDNYTRPCQWVMWSPSNQKALIVSPEESNSLIPILRQKDTQDCKVHLIVYSAPVTRRMLHFNSLDYHAIPALPADFKAPVWLRVELGIFSGRLHLEWDEYYELLRYLGLQRDLSSDLQNHAFAKKPLTFLHEWLALRRKGQDFEHTPMGFVTAGKPLTKNHPFFRSMAHDSDPENRLQVARLTSGRPGDEDEEENMDNDDDEFVLAAEPIDDSDGEDGALDSDGDESFVDALEDPA